MANTLRLEIIVDDKGTPVVQKFADGTHAALGKVEDAGGKMGGGFEQSWAGIATGANQAIQLFQEVSASVRQVWDLAKQGADFNEQRDILDNLSKKYGQTADSIVADMARAADGQIANADLMKVSLEGVAKGLKPEQLINLADAARILGDAVGKDATTSLNELTQALESGRLKGLKGYMGTALDLKAVFGDLEGKLSDAEKAQAMYLVTMIHASKMQAEQTKGVDGTADAIERFEAQLKNSKTSISQSAAIIASNMLPALSLWSEGVSSLAKDWNAFMNPKETGIFEKQAEGIKAQIKGIQDMQKSPLHDLSGEAEKQLELLYKQLAIVQQSIKNEAAGMYGKGGTEATVDPKIAAYQAQIDKLKEKLQVEKDGEKAAKDAEVADKKRLEYASAQEAIWLEYSAKQHEEYWVEYGKEYDKAQKAEMKSAEDTAKYIAEREKEWLEFSEKESKEYYEGIAKYEDDAVKEAKKAGSDRLQAERDVYKDLRGYDNQYYEASKALIDKQAKNYRDLGVDKVAVDKWVEEETRKAKRAETLSTENFFAGVRVGLDDLTQRHTTWAQTGSAVTAAFAAEAEKQMSANFFNVLKGNFDQLNMNWTSLWDSMLQVLADRLAKMATEMLIDRGLSAAGNLISDIIGKSGAAEYIWDLWAGAAVGQWMVREDKLAKIHQGEMIVPKEYAGMLRDLFASGGGTPGPGESFGAGAAQSQPSGTPSQDAYAASEFAGHMGKGAALGAVAGFAMGGFPGALAGLATGAVRGGMVGVAHGLAARAGLTEHGRAMNAIDDAMAAALADAPSAMADAMANAAATAASYAGEYSGASDAADGASAADSEGPGSTSGAGSESGSGGAGVGGGGGEGDGGSGGSDGGDGGNGGGRYGGIFRGPDSGYWTRMHGQEAIVPLPNGRSIPVEMKGGENGKPSIGEIRIYLDGEEIKGRVKIIADGVVVERNRRGVNATTRVYS